MVRLFVGLELPPSIKERVGMLCRGLPGARWQTYEQMHITLRFIGEVDPRQAEDIDAALTTVRAPALAVRFSGVDIFGDTRKPRTLWTGLRPEQEVRHLHDKVESTLVRTGLARENRKFKPHLTLARFGKEKVRRLPEFLSAHNDFSTSDFVIDEFTLFRSHLSHNGAAYDAVARYPLTLPATGEPVSPEESEK